jgi:signal transduction histidine kinase
MDRGTTTSRAVELVVDVAPTAGLTALTAIGLATRPGDYAEPRTISAVLLVGAAVALVVRRRRPVTAVIVAAGLVSTYLLGLSEDLTRQPPFEPFLVMVVAFFALGLHADGRARLLGAGVAGAALVAAAATMVLAGRPIGEALPSLIFWTAAGVLGGVVRRFRTAAATAHQAAAEVARRRDADLQEAVADERARIARELHDVVAHALSVIVIQASVEGRLHRQKDSSAAQTLGTIESTGRSALEDLRRLLGLLRAQPTEATDLAPLPTLADLETTTDRLRAAGHDVSLELAGDVRELPAGVGLSAYRIAQEAITNAVKHAPGSPVRVQVRYDADGVVVSVEDDGPRDRDAAPHTLPGGHGLLGMRERVRLYSGRLDAGPAESGGFRVRALLPIRTEGA